MALAKIFFAAVFIAYPFIVYFGLDHFDPRTIAVILIGIAIIRLILVTKIGTWAISLTQTKWIAAALVMICSLVIFSNTSDYLKFYPLLVNISMLIVFFASLLNPPTVIERIARIKNPELPPEGIRYTRNVTIVWCFFFFVNGAMALYTSLASDVAFWAVYNGLISYVIMGILFIGEYAIRRKVLPTMGKDSVSK